MIERVAALEVAQARHEERIGQIEDCMNKQNGRLERIEEKLDRLYLWLIGVLGGVVASLVLLVVNLGTRR